MSDFKVTYKGNFSTEMIHLESGNKIITDAPKDNKGLGRKFSPTDLVASSLGSCLLTIMGIVAKRHNISLDKTYADVQKKMSEKPRRISQIIVDIYFNSTLSDKNRKLLINSAKHCPVHNSLNSEIDIQINFK